MLTEMLFLKAKDLEGSKPPRSINTLLLTFPDALYRVENIHDKIEQIEQKTAELLYYPHESALRYIPSFSFKRPPPSAVSSSPSNSLSASCL